VLAYRIDQEKKQTEIERQAADDAREVAQKNEVRAVEAQKQAEINEKKAQENAETAVKQSKIALGALGTLIDKVQEQIGDKPGMQDLQAKLLETALEELDKVAKSDEDKRLHSQYIAGAYMKLGNLFRQLGQSEKAFTQYQKCHEIIKSMVERDAERAEVARDNMASTFTVLGEMSRELKHDLRGALDYYRQALEIRKDLTSRPLKRPDKLDPVKLKGRLAESYTRVGIAHLLLGEPALALNNFEQAKTIRQDLVNQAPTGTPAQIAAARSLRLDLARSYNALGEARLRNREWEVARTDFAQALAVGEAVHREDPKNPTYRFELGNTLGNAGLFEVRAGRIDDANRHYERFRARTQELADLDPKNTFYQRALGLANYRSGALARRQNNAELAQAFDQKCLQIREKLAAADAKSERRRIELMLVRPRCGQHVQAAEDADRLLNTGSTAPPDREVLVEMAQCFAQCAAAVTNDPGQRAAYVQKALDSLSGAIDQGYKDIVILETEPDLDTLREDPRFQKLLDRLRTN
jgi:tetratricopeptide (TPR) repeat protein